MNRPGPLIVQRPGLRDELECFLGPEDVDAAGREGATDQGPVGLHEAEHPVHGNLRQARVVEGSSDLVDLLARAGNQLAIVARPHHQGLGPRPEQASVNAQTWATCG